MTDLMKRAYTALYRANGEWVSASGDIPMQSFMALARRGLATHRTADSKAPAKFHLSAKGKQLYSSIML